MQQSKLMLVYLWLYALLSEGIIGFAHAALVVLGGSAVVQSSTVAPIHSVKDLMAFAAIGAAIRIFNYLDAHPLPAIFQTGAQMTTTVESITELKKPTT